MKLWIKYPMKCLEKSLKIQILIWETLKAVIQYSLKKYVKVLTKNIVAKNSIYNFVGQLIIGLLGLFSVKFILSELGSDILGLIYFSNLLGIILVNSLDKGIFALTVREVAKFYQKNDKKLSQFTKSWSGLFLY